MPNEWLEIPESHESFYSFFRGNRAEKDGDMALNLTPPAVKFKEIKPEPSFCIKTKDKKGSKYFINVCTCPEIPAPRDIDESELEKLLFSDELSYRVPISIGDGHREKDKSGGDCVAFDVIVNNDFLKKTGTSEMFMQFIVTLCHEGVETKYNLNLKNDTCIILKNKKYHGKMPNHFIQDRPVITELGCQTADRCHNSGVEPESMAKQKPVTEDSKSTTEDSDSNDDSDSSESASDEPKSGVAKYELRAYPKQRNPKLLILLLYLPQVASPETISLDVSSSQVFVYEGTDRICFRRNLPYKIKIERCSAQFDVTKKILFVSMPIAGLYDQRG